jgi:hypothetical protein
MELILRAPKLFFGISSSVTYDILCLVIYEKLTKKLLRGELNYENFSSLISADQAHVFHSQLLENGDTKRKNPDKIQEPVFDMKTCLY